MQFFTYRNFYLLYLEAEFVLAEALDFCEYKLKLSRGEFAISVPSTCVLPKHIDNGRLILMRPEQTLGFGLFNHREQFTLISSAKLAALVMEVAGSPREIKSIADIKTTKPESKPVTDVPDTFKNMLLDVKIEGKYPPMAHQFSAAWFKATHARAFDLSTMRTGKTGSTMLALEYLFRTQAIKHVMVLAPLSCVHPVWVDAIHQTMLQHVVGAVIGTRAQRLRAFAGHADILCANYESVKLYPAQWRKFHPDAVVIDECTHYANMQSQRSKAIKALIKDVQPRYVWGLTGTPGSDPLKAFAMSKLINPMAVKCKSLHAWRDLTMYKWGQQDWQWRNRECAPEMIREALSPAILFKKDDLFDLPPVVWVAREVESTAQQRKLMDKLRDDMTAAADNGETVTAQQKSVLVSKLLQCACGAVYSDSGQTVALDITSRLAEIKNLIGEATGKTVIFCAFTGAIQQLYSGLMAMGLKCAVVDGATSERNRTEIFRAFQYERKGEGNVDVLIAHPRTTAFGVELSAADMMIFNGAPLSGDFVFGQAIERLSSVKQKAKQITIAQVYSCPEERRVFKALAEGQTQAAVVADLFNSVRSLT